jgi:hypothetical protein
LEGWSLRQVFYEEAAREANIPPNKLDELSKVIREEFPHDDMMYELHRYFLFDPATMNP